MVIINFDNGQLPICRWAITWTSGDCQVKLQKQEIKLNEKTFRGIQSNDEMVACTILIVVRKILIIHKYQVIRLQRVCFYLL